MISVDVAASLSTSGDSRPSVKDESIQFDEKQVYRKIDQRGRELERLLDQYDLHLASPPLYKLKYIPENYSFIDVTLGGENIQFHDWKFWEDSLSDHPFIFFQVGRHFHFHHERRAIERGDTVTLLDALSINFLTSVRNQLDYACVTLMAIHFRSRFDDDSNFWRSVTSLNNNALPRLPSGGVTTWTTATFSPNELQLSEHSSSEVAEDIS